MLDWLSLACRNDVDEKATAGNKYAKAVMQSWADAEWFTNSPAVPEKVCATVLFATPLASNALCRSLHPCQPTVLLLGCPHRNLFCKPAVLSRTHMRWCNSYLLLRLLLRGFYTSRLYAQTD